MLTTVETQQMSDGEVFTVPKGEPVLLSRGFGVIRQGQYYLEFKWKGKAIYLSREQVTASSVDSN